MAATIAEAFVQITPSTKDMQSQISKALQNLDKVGDKAGMNLGAALGKSAEKSFTSSGLGDKLVSGLGKSLKAGALGIGAAAGGTMAAAFAKGFGRLNALDQAEAKLKGLGFGAADVERAMEGVTKSVKGTAFGLDEAAGSAAKFTGVGMKIGDELDRAMKLTADIAAQAGTGMDDVSNIIAKIAGAGKVTGETLAQLDERAVGASDAIAKHLGVSIDEARAKISAGEVDFETFSQAMEKKLGGAALSTGDTFKGSMDNMMSALGRFGAKLLEPVFSNAPAVFGAVGGVFDELGEKLEPVIESFASWLAPQMENLATNVIPGLVDKTMGFVDGLIAMGGWVKDNASWLTPLAASLGGMVGGVMAAEGATSLFNQAMERGPKLLEGLSKGLGLLTGHPVLAAIGLLTGALVYFFTQTETGRELWGRFTEFLGSAWDTVVEKFQTGVQWMSDAWSGLTAWFQESGLADWFTNAFTAVWEKLQEFGTGLAQFKDTWLVPIGEFLSTVFVGAWNLLAGAVGLAWSLIQPVFAAIGTAAQVLASVFVPIFQTVLGAAWTAFATVIQSVWNNIIRPTWEVLKSAFGLVADVLTGNFSNLGNRFNELGNRVSALVRGVFQAAWDYLKAGVQFAIDVAKGIFNSFKDKVAEVASAVRERVDRMVDGIKSIPGKIKDAFANAGSWLLDAGKNIIRGLADGIRNAGEMIADAVRAVVPDSLEKYVPGLHFGGVIPAFARGGVLPRVPGISDSQRDPILGLNGQGVPIARVEPGEFIVNRASTKKYGKLLAAINSGALDSRKGDWGLPGYNKGGLVSAKQLLAFARGQNVDGKQAPRSLEGSPYVWGGGLLGNWGDCSGAMSGLAAFVVGMALAGRKFATMNEGSILSQMGFSRGTSGGKNAFEIGFFNGGPYGGHTSGTIYDANGSAINVEMGGGRGNGQIGGAAAGSRHSQYTDRYWIGLKEAAGAITGIVSTSVRGMTVKTEDDKGVQLDQVDWGTASNLASEWDKDEHRRKQLRKWSMGVFDTGGILPKDGIAVNHGGPEYVLPTNVTSAMIKTANHIPGLAKAMERFTGVDWKTIGAELKYAWLGEDAGYGELANLIGDRVGERVADAVAFGGAMYRDVQKGDNIRTYLENMSATEGLGLADKVGSLFGIDGLQSTFGGVVGAWTDLEDAAVAQVDAAEGVKQAEANLVKARKSGDKEAIKSAQEGLSQAAGVAGQAAAMVGQAQIAMAIQVATLIVEVVSKVIKWIGEKVQAVFAAQIAAWNAVQQAFASMGKLTETISRLRHEVAGLTVDWAMALIELTNAQRNLRFVQHEGVVAQLQGAVDVAELQAEFEAQRKADMRAALVSYDDLSLAYDAFRWSMAGANAEVLDEMAAWSDESHRIHNELLAAQVGQKILEKQAILDNLEATWKLAQASFKLDEVTADLAVAAQKLAVASGATFGMDQKQATVGERYAELIAEQAQLQADNAAKWWSISFQATVGKQNRRRIDQINAQLRELEQMDEFKDLDQAALEDARKAVRNAGWLGFIGQGDQVAQLVKNSGLGDAARALEEIDFQNKLIDLDAERDAREREIAQGIAEVDYLRESSPLETAIRGLESERDSFETMAKYWGTSNEDVREALLRLAEAQSEGARIVQIEGESVTTADLAAGLAKMGIRVEKLEKPKPDAAAVVAGRR